jgi:hypothetical protein
MVHTLCQQNAVGGLTGSALCRPCCTLPPHMLLVAISNCLAVQAAGWSRLLDGCTMLQTCAHPCTVNSPNLDLRWMMAPCWGLHCGLVATAAHTVTRIGDVAARLAVTNSFKLLDKSGGVLANSAVMCYSSKPGPCSTLPGPVCRACSPVARRA